MTDPLQHRPHPLLHGPGRTYGETNCYMDLLIELLHASGHEPLAMLGVVLRTEWEGDQFTYAKPHPADLEALYGLDVHEILPYRPLTEHIELQLTRGRTLMFEADAFYLPDTAGTSYRREHLKTTVAPTAIDPAGERLTYFHNAGHHELSGEDYRGVFRLLPHVSDGIPDPFTELVSFHGAGPLPADELRVRAAACTARHLAARPSENPFVAWGASLTADVERLAATAETSSQGYAFVSARMAGSSFELLADHAAWLLGPGGAPSAAEFRRIVEGCKTLSFRLARRRPFDHGPAIAALADGWEAGTAALADGLAARAGSTATAGAR